MLHGDDSPCPDWLERVMVAFRLDRRPVRVQLAAPGVVQFFLHTRNRNYSPEPAYRIPSETPLR